MSRISRILISFSIMLALFIAPAPIGLSTVVLPSIYTGETGDFFNFSTREFFTRLHITAQTMGMSSFLGTLEKEIEKRTFLLTIK